jgi:hypothetical protein
MHPSINRLIDDHLGRAARVHTSAKRQGFSYIKTAKRHAEESLCKLAEGHNQDETDGQEEQKRITQLYARMSGFPASSSPQSGHDSTVPIP